jgi:hypothetical protein
MISPYFSEVLQMVKYVPVKYKSGEPDLMAKVDDENFGYISEHEWMLSPSGYAWTFMIGSPTPITMHRMVVGVYHSLVRTQIVDHVYNDRLDNQFAHLRICTMQENNFNRTVQKNNKVGLKGVYGRNGKYRATIRLNGVFHHLGDYTDKYMAALAYNTAATALFGDYAWHNYIPAGYADCVHDLAPAVMKFAWVGGQ